MTNEERIATGKKPVGRPPESRSGPRCRYWVLVSYSNKTTLVLCAPPESDPVKKGKFPKEEAVSQFKEKTGVFPDAVEGPFYYQVGEKSSPKDNLLEQEIENPEYYETFPAIFDGWEGTAMKIKGHPEALGFIASKAIDGNKKTPPKLLQLKSSAVQAK